jgi:hypothetical protein
MSCVTALNDLPINDVGSLGPRQHKPGFTLRSVGQVAQVCVLKHPFFVFLEVFCNGVVAVACEDPEPRAISAFQLPPIAICT